MLAAFELPARLPLVIDAEQAGPVLADRRFSRVANDRQLAEIARRPAGDARDAILMARCCKRTGARLVILREDEPSDTGIPDGTGRPRMRQVPERHRRRRDARPGERVKRRHERWAIGIDTPLVVHALHQLPGRRKPPGQLCEKLVLLVGPRERWVAPRLSVVVGQIVIAGEKLQLKM